MRRIDKTILFPLIILSLLSYNCDSTVVVYDEMISNLNWLKNYDESRAIEMAYFSAASYCSKNNIEQWICRPCQNLPSVHSLHVVIDKNRHFQGFVGYQQKRDTIVIAFRGTANLRDWLDNLTFLRTSPYPTLPDVAVHEGFYKAYQSVAPQVTQAIEELIQAHPNASIAITGHSLGAAIAILCSFDLYINHNQTIESLWTFGQPRVGNAAFVEKCNEASKYQWRITHGEDIVPHVPQSFMGFQHTTTEIFYYDDGYRVCSSSNGEDPSCSNQCSPLRCKSIIDHLLYINVTLGSRNAC